MKFTLTTYDSTITHNSNYGNWYNAVDFIKILNELVNDFSSASGVSKDSIHWEFVTHSDWCKNCLVLWAKVPCDWQPTQETYVCDKTFNPNHYPNLVSSRNSFVSGYGRFVDINDYPPQNPHNLFRSQNPDILQQQ